MEEAAAVIAGGKEVSEKSHGALGGVIGVAVRALEGIATQGRGPPSERGQETEKNIHTPPWWLSLIHI